jgi:hypothetical protein
VLRVIEAADTVQGFVAARQLGDLATDRMLLLAVERNLAIV